MKHKFNGILALMLMLITQIAFAQDRVVSGTVTDKDGLPVPVANVKVKGTSTGTQTDIDGKYKIKANADQTLVFSYLGMKSQEVKASAAVMNVKMMGGSRELDEVVVVGYGTQKKKEVTGSISKIKGDALQGLVTPSFESQLAGRAAGVQVTTQTGILGAPPLVRIRGTASISSGVQPLYVVDGIPIISGDVGGYASASGLGDINPNDIETYDVLKDGAATAIYGSRAANGVILITTKKGKKGTMKISYNSVVGIASPVEKFDLLRTNDFLVIANEKRTNRGLTPWASGSSVETDWQGAVLNSNALQIDHFLSLNGGSDKTKYYLSGGYTNQDGIAKANNMIRYNFKTNIEHEINKWLSVGGGVALTRTDYNGLNVGRNSLSGNISNATRQLPNNPIYDSTNPTGYNINLANGLVGNGTNLAPIADNLTNIVYVLDKNKQTSSIQRMLLNTFLQAKLTKDLDYRLQASVDNPITKGLLFWDPTHGDGRSANGRLQNNSTSLLRYNFQHILNFNKTIFDDHNIAATAVYEIQKERNESFFGVGTNLLNEFYNQHLVTNAYGTQESGGSVFERGIVSYVGRASYNYKQKYFAQASIRRDGISQLDPSKRWTNFIGYSGGWNISKESFMNSFENVINDFKLRASYAEAGNIDIGSYPYLGLTGPSPYGAQNGIAFSQFGNDQLQWESSKKYNYGVDLGFLNDRVKFNAEYFINDIDNLILAVPTPPSLGIPENRINKNIGVMRNDGYEFNTDIAIFRNTKFKWDINANLTFQQNVVRSLPNNGADIIGGSSTEPTISANIIIREGESINSLYGFEYAGVNMANGFPMYVKANGQIVQANYATNGYSVYNPSNPTDVSVAGNLVASDRKLLGNTLPTYFGGLSSNMSYENFDFSFLIRFSGGNKVFNSTRRALMSQSMSNNISEIMGRWQSPSNPGDGWTPKLWSDNNFIVNQDSNASSRFVEDGDFISLDNVSLGYSLPKKLMDKIKIDTIRLFVQAQNLLMFTKYQGLNPEMETFGVDMNGTPRASILSMGINIKL